MFAHRLFSPPNARWLHISGQVAVDKDGKTPETFEAQVALVFENLEHIVEIDTDELFWHLAAPTRLLREGHLPVASYLAVPVISRSGAVIGGHPTNGPERRR